MLNPKASSPGAAAVEITCEAVHARRLTVGGRAHMEKRGLGFK